jgi:hypothetical protein
MYSIPCRDSVEERDHDLRQIERERTAPNEEELIAAEVVLLREQCETPAGADTFIRDWEYPHTAILVAYAELRHDPLALGEVVAKLLDVTLERVARHLLKQRGDL